MSDDMDKVLDSLKEKNVKSKPVQKKKDPIIASGLDCGTMNLCFSRSDKDDITITRNMFLKLDSDEISKSDLRDISFVEMDGNVYIIGEDSFRMANIFNKKVSRPMEKGMISPKEIDAIDVLTIIVKNLFGDIKDKEIYCSYSVPAEAIDLERSVTYHEKVFSRILGNIGVNHKSINESMAIVFAECEKENYTGIGISFGAGMCNVACSYKGVEVFKFATTRSGDWIDMNVAQSLNLTQNRVTNIKEKYLDLSKDFMENPNKKTRRTLEALHYYYFAMIGYTIKNIIKQFEQKFDLELDEELPIIVSGGTSLAGGFLQLFKDSIGEFGLPFEVSEIRQPKNPLTCVSQGLLVKTLADLSVK